MIPRTLAYGKMNNGDNALEAILLGSKNFVGIDRQAECDFLIKNLREYINSDNHYVESLEKINLLYIEHQKEKHPNKRYEIEKRLTILEKERSDIERTVGTFTIARVKIKEKRPFPKLSFTLVNRTGEGQTIIESTIKIQRLPGVIYFTARQTKILPPLAVWDIKLPSLMMSDIHTFKYSPEDSIWLIDSDATTIDMRFYFEEGNQTYPFDERTSYTTQITFNTDRGMMCGSEIIQI